MKLPPDLTRLRESLDGLEDLADYLELRVMDDPDGDEPTDTSYLNEDDRANADILANVEAITETNKLIA